MRISKTKIQEQSVVLSMTGSRFLGLAALVAYGAFVAGFWSWTARLLQHATPVYVGGAIGFGAPTWATLLGAFRPICLVCMNRISIYGRKRLRSRRLPVRRSRIPCLQTL